MPRSGVVLPPQRVETPAGMRELAARARRFARMLAAGDEGAARLREFARELESRAAQIETIEVKRPID